MGSSIINVPVSSLLSYYTQSSSTLFMSTHDPVYLVVRYTSRVGGVWHTGHDAIFSWHVCLFNQDLMVRLCLHFFLYFIVSLSLTALFVHIHCIGTSLSRQPQVLVVCSTLDMCTQWHWSYTCHLFLLQLVARHSRMWWTLVHLTSFLEFTSKHISLPFINVCLHHHVWWTL